MVSVVQEASSRAGKAGMLGNLLANLDGLVYRCLIENNWTMEFLSEGRPALTGYSPEHHDAFLRVMAQQDGVINFESQVFQRNGNVIWISENARAVRGANQEILYFEGMVVDITERKLYEAKIQHQATHDALTGLPNRNLLYDRLRQAILAADRTGEIVAVAFMDLGQFKFINDSLGHQIGDELLKTVAARIQSRMRAGDTVLRQGGDEFVIVLGAQKHCMLAAIAAIAIYKAKELGRSNIQYFAAEMNLHATESTGSAQQLAPCRRKR